MIYQNLCYCLFGAIVPNLNHDTEDKCRNMVNGEYFNKIWGVDKFVNNRVIYISDEDRKAAKFQRHDVAFWKGILIQRTERTSKRSAIRK